MIAVGLTMLAVARGQDSSGYAPVGALKMYYEIHETSHDRVPLVLLHGGGSTIQTSFGAILPLLCKDREVVAVELQGHGHTADIDRPESFEQDADDVAALMHYLKIDKADFFGFSNGGGDALQIAIRHPKLVRKLVVASAAFKRDAFSKQFWDRMEHGTLDDMPSALKEAYLKVAPHPNDLQVMFQEDRNRMLQFKDWPADEIRSIESPVLIMNGDHDVVRPEHTIKMYRLLPHGRLAILPGAHGEYIGTAETTKEGNKPPAAAASIIEGFLVEPMPQAATK
ncbi:MAG TPA: alpha/beta hydrolase [Candidatus Acidoferrales bacterium]|nr:alpha/beta hydrolase [Candidatus Acidoferrales bacterium]